MSVLVIGLLLFFAAHLVPTRADLKRQFSERLGVAGYKIAFSTVSLVGLALIVVGFGEVRTGSDWNPQLWIPPVWARHLAFALMLPAFVLLVAAYVPSRIRSAIRHPMLAAVKTWAFSHLLANGDLASLLLFGSFLAYAVYDRISLKYRAVAVPEAPVGVLNDIVVLAGGAAAYGFMLTIGHARLIGMPLLPGWA